jgi:DNA-binding NarL/FixJ family response regulator
MGGGTVSLSRQRALMHMAEQPEISPERFTLRGLSPRECETLELAAEGLRSHEIAVRLGIAEGTVKTHHNHTYRKLRVTNRVEAITYYLRARGVDR